MYSKEFNMKVHPLRDQVVVSKAKEEEKTSPGGLYMPSLTSSKLVAGTVVAAGSGRITTSGTIIPLEVVAGDQVLFNPSAAQEVAVDGQTFFVLREDGLTVLR
jgi:chaperonin GroES